MIQQWVVGSSYSRTVHMDAIKAYLSSPASGSGWSFVETVVPAAGQRGDVYKLASAFSGFPGDLHVIFWDNASTLRMAIAEGWDTATKKVQRVGWRTYTSYGYSSASSMPASGNVFGDDWLNPFTDSVYVSTYLANAWFYVAWMTIDALAANVVCMFSATPRGLILTSKANDVYYAGFYESALPSPTLNDPMPTVLGRNSASYPSITTRMPMSAGTGYRLVSTGLGSMRPLNYTVGPRWINDSYPGQNGVGDKFLGGKFSLNAIYLVNYVDTTYQPSDEFGFYRGYLRDLMFVPANATYITWGDYSVDSDGNSWVFNNQGYALREFT